MQELANYVHMRTREERMKREAAEALAARRGETFTVADAQKHGSRTELALASTHQ